MNTFFSIIITVYNNEKYLPLAVKSIEDQCYDNYELIIIDDGSTDNTSVVVDNLAAKNNKIRVVHQKNQWIYASFNNGIALAKGDYIYILNSDDLMLSGSLELLNTKVIQYNKPDVVWTRIICCNCDENQNILKYDTSKEMNKNIKEYFAKTQGDVRKIWPFLVSEALAQNQANLYKREIMQSHKFRNDVYGADTLYNISLVPDLINSLIIEEPVYMFMQYVTLGRNTSSGKYYAYENRMFCEIFETNYDLYKNWNLPDVDFIIKKRLSQISAVIKHLNYPSCNLTIDQKLKEIFTKYYDRSFEICIRVYNCEEEIESRILSGVKFLLEKEQLSESSEMYFVYELLESLLRYEKDEEDYKKIERAINHPLNPRRIGRVFYNKLLNSKDNKIN